MTFPFAIVGFDLDGTLFDTSAELAASVNHTLAGLGYPDLPTDQILGMVGLGARNMLREGVVAAGGTAEQARAMLPDLLAHYRDHLGEGSTPYSGCADALDALAARGVTLAVVTNKYERFAETLLERTGWRGRFAAVIGGDTMGKGRAKPHAAPILEMARRCGGGPAAFVGDSVYDIDAARAAGVPSVGVRFGFGDPTGADAVIDEYRELVGVLERLGTFTR